MARREVNIAAILDGQLAKVSESDTGGREQIEYIDLDLLDPDPRNFYNLPGIPELAENIRLVGLQQPLRVRPKEDGHFEIVTGHRRHRALLRLAKEEGLEQFSQVPCIRERTGESPEMERIRLIFGNSDNRKLSSAELARQAEEIDEILLSLSKNGYPLSGRRRAYVAELLNVRETKVANAMAIKNGLKVPGIREKWAQNEIPEAAALEIARLPAEAQYRLLDWVIDGHHDYSIRSVKKFARMWTAGRKECPETGGFCQHAEAITDHDYRGGNWTLIRCCKSCDDRDTCSAACQYAERVSEHESDDCETVDTASFGARLRKARKTAGLTQDELGKIMGRTGQNVNQYELNLRSPKIETAHAFAEALHVSLHDLMSIPETAQWQLLDEDHWPADGQLVAIAYDNPLGGTCYMTARCVGGYHDLYPFEDTNVGCELDEPSHGEYECGYWWMPLPEKEG